MIHAIDDLISITLYLNTGKLINERADMVARTKGTKAVSYMINLSSRSCNTVLCISFENFWSLCPELSNNLFTPITEGYLVRWFW